MKLFSKYKILLLVTLSLGMTACSDTEPAYNHFTDGLEIFAGIESLDRVPETRVTLSSGNGTDNWYFNRFSSTPFPAHPLSQPSYVWEEAIGFYSKYGNKEIMIQEGSGNNTTSKPGPFVNEKFSYGRDIAESVYSSFISTKMNIDLNSLTADGTMAYFPYTPDMEETGLELRWKKNENGWSENYDDIERCIDALIMRRHTSSGNSVSGLDFNFIHAFSEMIIFRGEGFDNPPSTVENDDKIWIVLEDGYSHAKLKNYERASDDNLRYEIYKVFDFYYKDGYVKSKEDCRRWETSPGKYSMTQSGTAAKIMDVEYALVPGGYGTGRPSVAYIEICDNNGDWHKVTDFSLYEDQSLGNKKLNWSERYLLEIKMEGLVPTVNPVVITPWAEDKKVAQRDAAGIASIADFSDFVREYNLYNTNRNNASAKTIQTLSNYGDKTLDSQGNIVSWHFYFIDNLEFTSGNTTIPMLHKNDIIDGYNSQLTNLTNPFINNLEGTLIGFDFTVNMKAGQGDPKNTFGAIASKINGGYVKGCSVSGSVNYPLANVGMLAGDMEGGTVENCSFSGLLIGRSTYNKMIGNEPTGTCIFKSNSTSGVLFPGETD